MHFKKLITVWAFMALLLGQATLAEHSASHIDHGFTQEIASYQGGHDEHQHDHDNKKHECPECLLAESLQIAFYNTPSVFSVTTNEEGLVLINQSSTIILNRSKANAPRAPPALLI